jgi:hypothetical protein
MSAYMKAAENLQVLENMLATTLAQQTALLCSLLELSGTLSLPTVARLLEAEIDRRRRATIAAVKVRLMVCGPADAPDESEVAP